MVSGAGERWRGGEKGGRGGYIDRRREVAGGQPVILKILPDLVAPFFFFSFFFFFSLLFSHLLRSSFGYGLLGNKNIFIGKTFINMLLVT